MWKGKQIVKKLTQTAMCIVLLVAKLSKEHNNRLLHKNKQIAAHKDKLNQNVWKFSNY